MSVSVCVHHRTEHPLYSIQCLPRMAILELGSDVRVKVKERQQRVRSAITATTINGGDCVCGRNLENRVRLAESLVQ